MKREGAKAAFVGVNAGAIVLALWSIVRPFPFGIALLVALVWLGTVLLGVFFPHFGMFVDAHTEGPRERREIALTFDDGPHPIWTREVLATLHRHGAHATFFVIGKKAEAHPDLLKEIVEAGHALGIHSYTHDRFLSLRTARDVKQDLARAQRIVEQASGARCVRFRPPVGHTSPTIARAVLELGLIVVAWSARTLDGVPLLGDPARRLARMTHEVRPGSILLFHDASERSDERPQGLNVLVPVLEAANKAGLRCVTLGEWNL